MPKSFIDLDPLGFRIATLVGGVLLATLLLYSATWFFGDAIASSAGVLEVAELSKSMSPTNPRTYIASSIIQERSFRDEDRQAALENVEIAVSISPHDFLLWQSLARLRERSGDIVGAEKALRRALELAPNYASVQWAFGNVLLRQDKNEEAFEYIRSAVEKDSRYAGPAASIAWDVHEGSISKITESIGQSGQVKSALALYISKLERFDESYEIWQSLSKEERTQTNRKDSQAVLKNFIRAKRYLFAVSLAKELTEDKGKLPQVAEITNGGFELDVAREAGQFFDWSIQKGEIPSVGVSVDEQRSGRKSLAVFFEGLRGKEFRRVSQNVAVRGGESYKFSLSYKSELVSDATLYWQIVDTAGGGVLAATEPILAKSDWTLIETEFSVPEGSEGVTINLVRQRCSRLSCPISGTVWFDDVEVD
jgi:Tfp pilus assembly protein PilF